MVQKLNQTNLNKNRFNSNLGLGFWHFYFDRQLLLTETACFIKEMTYWRTFPEAEVTPSLLMEVSSHGNSSRHGEQVLSPNGSHRHWPENLRRWHGSARKEAEKVGEEMFPLLVWLLLWWYIASHHFDQHSLWSWSSKQQNYVWFHCIHVNSISRLMGND